MTDTKIIVDAIIATGNVGIGTTSPDTLTEIVGANPILTIRDSSTGISDANATLRLAETGTSDTLDNYWDIKMTPELTGGNPNFAIARETIDYFNIEGDTGNVGIGTTSPTAKLEVAGVLSDPVLATDNGIFSIFGTTSKLALDFGTLTSAPWSAWIQSKDRVNNTAYPISLNPNGGNVGIGTTAPNELLELSQSQNPNLRFNNQDASVFAGDIFGTIGWNTNDPSSSGTGVAAKISAYAYSDFAGGTRSTNLGFFTASGNIEPTERLTIQSDGNVGIGTTAPKTPLDVKGTISSGHWGLTNPASSGTKSGLNIGFDSFSEMGWIQSVRNNTSDIKPLQLQPLGGNVGIGTTAPKTALHVVGGVSKSIVTKTTTYQATISDHTIVGNHATTAFTVTLPTAASAFSGSEGLMLYFVNKNVAVMTIDGSGAETISGAATQALSQWETLTVQSNGTEWFVL